MSRQQFVLVGAMGNVGRFQVLDSVLYPRASRVVCRTRRGLEIGDVLSTADHDAPETDGTLVRGVTVEDELLIARLNKRRHDAVHACEELIAARGLSAVLMDVEHLFDGESLYFYFLGEVSPVLESLTGELADTYEANVQFREFTQALTEGCGPGCGTDDAENGCASGACSTCAVVSACGSKHKH